MLRTGTVSTNAFLRKVHNFAVDMNWLPAAGHPPPTMACHPLQAETRHHAGGTPADYRGRGESRTEVLYQLCWHLGASQGDIANLKGEDVDWRTVR